MKPLTKKCTLSLVYFSFIACFFSIINCKAQVGSLDIYYDNDVKLTTTIGTTYDAGNAVAIQSDGKIIVAGASSNGANAEFAVLRYHSNGSLDNSFDLDGKVTTAIGQTGCIAYAIAIQPDGKILVAGESTNLANKDFALVRYHSNGSLDLSFDSDGIVTTAIGNLSEIASTMVLQSDGKILLAGYSNNGHDIDFAIARYNADGSLDNGFDTDGIVTTLIDTFSDAIQTIAMQPDGKILVGGSTSNGSNGDFIVARYHSNGSLDTTFDSDGFVITTFGNSYDGLYAIALQPDGKIVAAGATFLGSNYDFAVARYNSNGSLDLTFDVDGKVTTPIGNGNDRIYAMKLQTDGKIVATGMTYNGTNDDMALARFNMNGSIDTSFDADGKTTTALGNSHDVANAIAIQSDGKIVVVGYSNNGANDDVAVCRYIGNAVASGVHESIPSILALKIYPNPCNKNVMLGFPTIIHSGELTICNYLGETVRTENGIDGGSITLDCSHFAKGMYYLKLTEHGSTLGSGKLLVQ